MLIRENYLSKIRGFYDSDLVKILVGIRRCGKSVILNEIIDEIKNTKNVDDKHIIIINFEFIEYQELKDYKKLNKYIKNLVTDDKIYYIFLDEVQIVDDFEVVVNSLRASLKNVSIFITGSNSKLLSNELSTVLSGRYVLFNIYPLSYKEYIALTGKDPHSIESFNDFVTWGGLPNRCEFDNTTDIKNYLHSVFDSIILRDVVNRLNLTDVTLFNMILQYLIDITGREFSPGDLLNFLESNYKKVSTETLYSYVDALCKALIINRVYRFNVHGKAILKTLSKYYVTDLGIAQIKQNNTKMHDYIALENVVYNELLIRGYQVYTGKIGNKEIDFVVQKDNQTKYVQVTYKLDSESTIEREFGVYNEIKDNFPKYVLSMDEVDFSRNGVIHKNIIDFLLDDDLA